MRGPLGLWQNFGSKLDSLPMMEGANMASKFTHELKDPRYSSLSAFHEVDRAPDTRTAPHSEPMPPEARKLAEILAAVDIRLNGNRPWDIQVRDQRFYRRLFAEGSLGAGESYMDGWWDAPALDEFFTRIHRLNPYDKVGAWGVLWLALKGRVLNRQTRERSQHVAQAHYDLGNDLYETMLGPRMQYTCAYWKGADTLDQAQENKLALICRKIQLAPGMKVLELGGGFGGLAHYMAAEYGQVQAGATSFRGAVYSVNRDLGLH